MLYDRKSALGAFPQPVGRLHSAAVLLEEDAQAFFRRYGEPQAVTGDESREALVERVQAMIEEAGGEPCPGLTV